MCLLDYQLEHILKLQNAPEMINSKTVHEDTKSSDCEVESVVSQTAGLTVCHPPSTPGTPLTL